MTQAQLEDIRKVLDRQGTTDPSFDCIAGRLLQTFDVQMASIHTLDPATGMLKLRCQRGLDPKAAEKIRFLCMGKSLPGKAAALRQPVQDHNTSVTGTFFPEYEVFPSGALFVPMINASILTGVLGIAKGFHQQFAPDFIASLTAVARLIASYLK